jgi:hypothetical protein
MPPFTHAPPHPNAPDVADRAYARCTATRSPRPSIVTSVPAAAP